MLPILFSLFQIAAPTALQSADTRVVVLGVEHSAQLVAEAQQPAALRAFFNRVNPAAIAIERPPEEFSRGDHYEFTYEIQYVALPYARERYLVIHPFDWIPPKDDMLLGFGVDLEALPFIREGWQGFISFPDTAALSRPLFFADSDADRQLRRSQFGEPWEPAARDLPRRMFWYRTFLQARRIARAAALHRGETLLVIVGANHKNDIERILAGMPGIEIVQPSSFGVPTAEEIEEEIRTNDLFAIATFNLLGVQSLTPALNRPWLDRVLDRLRRRGETPEVRLLDIRAQVLRGVLPPADATRAYRDVRDDPAAAVPFTWNGAKDRSRIDSFFDPFGNITVAQRAAIEMARELYRSGDAAAGDEIRERLARELSTANALRLRAYWDEYVRGVV